MNLHRAFLVVSFALTAMLILIGGVTFAALSSFNEASAAARHRQDSLALMSEVHHEVGLLGRLVSSYVSTANSRFLIYYYDILAIREGAKPRPEGLPATYWEQVIAGSRDYIPVTQGQVLPFVERTSRLGFDAGEQAVVRKIYRITEQMKEVEQIAFAATQGLYDPASGEFVSEAEPQREFANRLLHEPHYLRLRADLAVAVQELSLLVDQRTAKNLDLASERLRDWIFSALVLLVGAGIVLLVSYQYLQRHLLVPLTRLHDAATALAGKNFAQRVGNIHGVEEVQALATTFDGMAAAIEADLTQREEAQQALREARAKAVVATEAKSIFLANMSHEIRTPMNAILGMAYLAMKSGLAPRQQEYVSKIHAAARSLLGILNDILDFSKIEAGKVSLERTPFELEPVIQNALFMVQQRAESKRLELILDYRLNIDFPALIGDPLRLGQILINLLSNAVKFTDTGHVRLSISELASDAASSKLLFSVEDTGIGMSTDELSRLFQEFTQADGSTTRKYGGTGLGLSISKRLVEAMGGEVGVESVPGRGSIFHFSIQLPTAPGAGTAVSGPVCAGLRVLVVDDYAASCASVAGMLSRLGGAQVDQAASGGAALAQLRAATGRGEPYDILILDWDMPGLAGAALLDAIFASGLQLPLRTVIVSAADAALLRADVKYQGISEFLQKPPLPGTLRRICQADVRPRHEPAVSKPARSKLLGGMRILLVEDNELNQQVAVEILRDWGASVDIAANGRAALSLLFAREPDHYAVVLMDLEMPVMDGREAVRQLRADQRYAALPVIAMTAHALESVSQLGGNHGINGFITKPFEPDNLLALLSSYRLGAKCSEPVTPPALPPSQQSEVERAFAQFLGRVEGIDAGLLFSRFDGRGAFLARALHSFSEQAQTFPARLREALYSGDRDTARRLVHSFKGLSGTFAMTQLQREATVLEQAIADDEEGVVERLAELESRLQNLLAQLATLPESLSPTPAAPSPPAHELATLVECLQSYLREGDGEAEELWRANKTHLAQLFSPLQMAAIDRAIGEWNAEEALAAMAGAGAREERT